MNSAYGEVKAQLREWAEVQENGFDVWKPRRILAKKIPGAADSYGYATDLFMGQVLRALKALVDEGVLVKHGTHRHAMYFTQEANEAYLEQRVLARAEASERMERWAWVKAQLKLAGFTDWDESGTALSLSLEDWEKMFGRQLHPIQ